MYHFSTVWHPGLWEQSGGVVVHVSRVLTKHDNKYIKLYTFRLSLLTCLDEVRICIWVLAHSVLLLLRAGVEMVLRVGVGWR